MLKYVCRYVCINLDVHAYVCVYLHVLKAIAVHFYISYGCVQSSSSSS